jgi:NADPH:quinone reductase-like Zn-dependent oxidoreductase
MIAEKALISKNRYTVLPENLDYSTAAALPNAALGGAMPLLLRGNMQKGNTVLINGATGVTGNLPSRLRSIMERLTLSLQAETRRYLKAYIARR